MKNEKHRWIWICCPSRINRPLPDPLLRGEGGVCLANIFFFCTGVFMENRYSLSSYTYDLPEHFIAQEPVMPQDQAKLLVCQKHQNWYDFSDKLFADLPELLTSNDVLFFNATKVYPARLPLSWVLLQSQKFWEKKIDGEIFVYKILDDRQMECMVSDDKHFKPWNRIIWDDIITLDILSLTPDGVLFQIFWDTVDHFLMQYAQMPLPPYVTYTKEKEQRYQTIFAQYKGSAAAPTASLHFTEGLVERLRERGVMIDFATLHVGLWTFRPLYHDDILQHKMHEEAMLISPELFERIARYKLAKKSIIAVGTTMTRFLESLLYVWKTDTITGISQEAKYYRDELTQDITQEDAEKIISFKHNLFWTRLFIYPGYDFRLVDSIITNFHLPKTSLLLMIAAFMGKGELDRAYRHAMDQNYRFYSFGDGMLIR